MNVAIVAFNGFVGFEGATIRLMAGEQWNLDDPRLRRFYEANPDKFAAPEPQRPQLPKMRRNGDRLR